MARNDVNIRKLLLQWTLVGDRAWEIRKHIKQRSRKDYGEQVSGTAGGR